MMNGQLELISLDMTSRCNLRCAHCYNNSGESGKRDLNPEELLRTAEEIAALHPQNFCLCGGEPMLSEQLFPVLDIMRGNVAYVSMVSNGMLMTRDLAKELVRCGLFSVQISLDGAYAWQHDSLRGVEGCFERAKNALIYLKEAGIPQLSVSFIPNRMNQYSFEELIRLCNLLGVNVVRSMPMMPMGRGKTVGSSLMLDDREMFAFQRQLDSVRQRWLHRITIEWDDPVRSARFLCRRIGRGDSPLSVCITSDGFVNTDVYVPVTLGNVRERSLADLLHTELERTRHDGRFEDVLRRLHILDDL